MINKCCKSHPCIVQGEEHFKRGHMQCKGTNVGEGVECSWYWTGVGGEGRE